MFGLLKRYRELILVALLLVLPLGVFFARAKRQTEGSRLDRAVLTFAGPIEKGVGWVVGGGARVWDGYVALRRAHEKAAALERENEGLRLDALELQRVRGENERMRALLGFAQGAPERKVKGGRVIGVRLDPKGLQLVTIDRGSDDGLDRMMPVVVGSGVVGRVHAVTPSTSDVLLLSDRNSSIAVRVERSRARANVRGTGAPDLCRLEYALRSDDMVEGDLLTTSGTDGVFPRGLPVGKVAGLKKSGQGLYQRADVKPAVDLTKVEEVLVITTPERMEEEAPLASARSEPVGAVPARTPGPGAPLAPVVAKASAAAGPTSPKPSAPKAPAVAKTSGAAPAAGTAKTPGKASAGTAAPSTAKSASPSARTAMPTAKPAAGTTPSTAAAKPPTATAATRPAAGTASAKSAAAPSGAAARHPSASATPISRAASGSKGGTDPAATPASHSATAKPRPRKPAATASTGGEP